MTIDRKCFAMRLAALSEWRAVASWYAGEPGPTRAIARRISDDVAILIEELHDEIVTVCATPAERRRASERVERAAVRAAARVDFPWQQRARRNEYLADRAEEARDRQRAIGRVWEGK